MLSGRGQQDSLFGEHVLLAVLNEGETQQCIEG